MATTLRVYSKDNCPHCTILKSKLELWGYEYETINISEDVDGAFFLKEKGHRSVPQLYNNDNHVNYGDTKTLDRDSLETAIALS